MPNGEIQPEFTERLQQIGTWLKTYGETIYGTTAGFIKPQEWGAVTEKNNNVYLHVLNKTDDKLLIKIPYKIISAKSYLNKNSIAYWQSADKSTLFDISSFSKDEIDNVIELQAEK